VRDIFSAFGSEVFRPLITVLVPGLVALSTFFWTLLERLPIVRHLAETRRTETGIVLLLSALAIGEVLEDLGSHIETIFDYWKKEKDPDFDVKWHDYLFLSFKQDPIGRGYIKSLVLRLKFELGCSLGLFFCAFGVFTTQMPFCMKLALAALLLAGVAGGVWEGWETHGTLATARHELLARCQAQQQKSSASTQSSDS
jgi:hypothetical protein